MNYPITVHHIFVSGGHNYFGQPRGQPASTPTRDVDEVAAVAGAGLIGDRFFRARPDFDGQVTFFSIEVFRLFMNELDGGNESIVALRRNLVVEGVPLNQLIGQEFTIHFGEESVDFFGARHCHPCRWMDDGVAKGALKFLKGRGGLRAKILSDGLIKKGAALLAVGEALDLSRVCEPLARPRLP